MLPHFPFLQNRLKLELTYRLSVKIHVSHGWEFLKCPDDEVRQSKNSALWERYSPKVATWTKGGGGSRTVAAMFTRILWVSLFVLAIIGTTQCDKTGEKSESKSPSTKTDNRQQKNQTGGKHGKGKHSDEDVCILAELLIECTNQK